MTCCSFLGGGEFPVFLGTLALRDYHIIVLLDRAFGRWHVGSKGRAKPQKQQLLPHNLDCPWPTFCWSGAGERCVEGLSGWSCISPREHWAHTVLPEAEGQTMFSHNSKQCKAIHDACLQKRTQRNSSDAITFTRLGMLSGTLATNQCNN